MTAHKEYPIAPGWKSLLSELGIEYVEVLRKAGLPEDLLNREHVKLTAEALFRFCTVLDASIDDAHFWVNLTDALSPEFFTPPLFASLCSPDLFTAAERLARFKPLVGPLSLEIRDSKALEITYRWSKTTTRPPRYMHAIEAMFVVKLARLGTRQRIVPTSVMLPELPRDVGPINAYLGVNVRLGGTLRVSFSAKDACFPFVTSSPSMWQIFEPRLNQRLADLEGDATFHERTRAVLMEGLPSGCFTVNIVARRLAVSPRTLQRRLREEGTSFKEVVGTTREWLARHYLSRPDISPTEIAYLLGFEQPTSFFRAFQRWTGTTPESLRQQLVST